MPPECQQAHHRRQRHNLTNFHTHIEAQDAQQYGRTVVTQWQLLKACGQAKTVQQTKAEDRCQQVG